MLGQTRSTQRRRATIPNDEPVLVKEIIRLATKYGRYGYRTITDLLRNDGWRVNHKRVARLWRREGLKVPYKQKKKGRLWLEDYSCVRLPATHKDHVWSYDFVADRTHDGRPIRLLNIIDEYTRECLSIDVERRMNHKTVMDRLAELFIERGTPEYIRSDNGSEFVAKDLQDWLEEIGVKTAYIYPGSPWENGYIESFNARMRDEFLNGELFETLLEAKVLIERWRVHYNTVRPHSALGGRPPIAPETHIKRKNFTPNDLNPILT